MRTARRTALGVTLLATLLGAGTARADWQTDRAQAIAAKLWHDPCGGAVTVLPGAPPEPSWRAWTFPDRCTIVLSDVRPWAWSELCPVILHEYGHLAGYTDPANPADPTHSHDPADIMWPFEHPDARCDGFGAAFLGETAGGVGRAVSVRRKRPPRRRALRARRGGRRAAETAVAALARA
jgi:hypothetical protein